VKIVANDDQFPVELSDAGSKLVVVDFHATWCGPCLRISPEFVKMSIDYPSAVFLKVDVDQCEGTAAKYSVTAMPTFLFFRGKVKIDFVRGADVNALKEKIKKHLGDGEGSEGAASDTGVPGHIDLSTFISTKGCSCLNESDDHTYANILRKDGSYLESDCDEQLLLTLEFSQAMKLHSFKITAPDDGKGPKVIKLFTNQPTALSFDEAEGREGVQKIELTPEDLKGEKVIELRYVKFQNVSSVTIFVQNNQGEEETSVIQHLQLIGSPLQATNMQDFKRIAGKAGESH